MNTSKNQTTWKLGNQRKRIYRNISLLLALIMLLGVPLSANLGITEVEASDIIDSGTWGSNITWEFDGSTLTLRGNGAMQDAPITWVEHTYTIHTPWAKYKSQIKKIVINEGITHIGKANFSTYYQALITVVLPNSLTSIGTVAFDSNKNLKTINLPGKLKTIGDFAFSDCTNLNNITLPNSVTKIGEEAFYGCESFTKLTIPGSVKTIGELAFAGCSNLTTVKISNGVTKIGVEAFDGCKIKTIDLPSSVTSIGRIAFWNCNKLTSIKIRNKNCSISSNDLTIPEKTTIYGYKNSTAQKWAKKYNRKFKTLSSASSKTVKAKTLKITNAPKTLKASRSKTLKVKFTPSNVSSKKVTWKSSNKKYATVNSKGKVTAKKAGRGKTVKITATAKDGSKKKATVKIKIS